MASIQELQCLDHGTKVIYQYENKHSKELVTEEWCFSYVSQVGMAILHPEGEPSMQDSIAVDPANITVKKALPEISKVIDGYRDGMFNALEVCGAMMQAGVPNCVIKLFMDQHNQLKAKK